MSRLTIQPAKDAAFYQQLVTEHGSPLLLLDCQKLVDQYKALAKALPGVEFFYAIKSLPHLEAIRTLAGLGAGFDIATSGEVALLYEQGARPRYTIHTHPIKRDKDIRDALRFGCTTFVVDSVYELEKFVAFRHRVGLLIRVSFPNENAIVDLSRKFGCKPDEVEILLQKASQLGLHVKGLSFHVGSQCADSGKHVEAIKQCQQIIERCHESTGKLLSVLDIGGGFPVEYIDPVMDIKTFCQPIRETLGELPENVNVFAEPGRFLSAPAMTSISTIMGKTHRGDSTWYYLDNGVYGSYSGQIFDHATYPLTVFSDIEQRETAVLAGPTCDSIDVIAEDIQLPPMAIGDLVIGNQMGAYTSASATDFNLFERAKIVVINQDVIESINQDETIIPFK